MKLPINVAGASLLLIAVPAAAQDAPTPPPASSPAPIETAPIPPSETGTPSPAAQDYSDAQVASFVAAAMRMRELRADESLDVAARRAAAEQIVAEEGLDPDTYQAIGTAAQSDPALAQRIQMALAAMEADSGT